MARGKAASQNANRRAAEAAAAADVLRGRLAERDAAHRAEVAALRTELRAARSGLDSEVETRAAERIADVQRDAADQVAVVEAEADIRVRNTIVLLGDYITDEALDTHDVPRWQKFAAATHVELPEALRLLGVHIHGARAEMRRLAAGKRGCSCGHCTTLTRATGEIRT
jgi:hypothetical protein